jgi:opacity protein-like surface antigen
MRSKILLASLVTLGLTCFSQTGLAADNGFFIGGKYGATNVDIDGEDFDESDFSTHPQIGYDFNENWAIDLGFDMFGEPKSNNACGTDCSIKIKDFTGFNANLIGTYPMNDEWSVYGSVGWQYYEFKVRARDEALGVDITSSSEDGDEVVFGAGIRFQPWKTVSLKLGFLYFGPSDADVTSFYIGTQKNFH